MQNPKRHDFRASPARAGVAARPTGLRGSSQGRYLGIDLGAETIKLVELLGEGDGWRLGRRTLVEHGKDPGSLLLKLLEEWDWEGLSGAAVTGRLSRQTSLFRVPTPQAQSRGFRHLNSDPTATLVSIGSHGFSVLELRPNGQEVYRENNRCSQGTGNFLRQLIERFALSVEEASELCAGVESAAPLSGRCPVILKTDMTHLANKGEDRGRILAGLFDAVCENVFVLIKPGISPKQVYLTGGVSRSPRVRRVFTDKLARHGMNLADSPWEETLYFEALGSALIAAEQTEPLPPLDRLLAPPAKTRLERLPALADALPKVRRLPAGPPVALGSEPRQWVLGFDIGSTGSKAVAVDVRTRETCWSGYRQTEGAPVAAAQALLQQFRESPAGTKNVIAFGVTGSGREIVGSLMTTCYGKDAVFILNEIAAHAEGACHYDARVDTIFEIGGQDAKYIRLAEGRVVDCAMNEACSAGTGSFIEEQGRKFAGIQNVAQLGQAALAAPGGVSLGQHCSVFMAEIIDEAVAAGIEAPCIIALYDSGIATAATSLPGTPSDPDDNVDRDDNGQSVVIGLGGGVASRTISLGYDSEPDGNPDTDGDADADTNLTLDFGFRYNQPPTVADLNGDGVLVHRGRQPGQARRRRQRGRDRHRFGQFRHRQPDRVDHRRRSRRRGRARYRHVRPRYRVGRRSGVGRWRRHRHRHLQRHRRQRPRHRIQRRRHRGQSFPAGAGADLFQ